MKKLLPRIALLLSLVTLLSVMTGFALAEESEDVFSQWNENAPALDALIDYAVGWTRTARCIRNTPW